MFDKSKKSMIFLNKKEKKKKGAILTLLSTSGLDS